MLYFVFKRHLTFIPENSCDYLIHIIWLSQQGGCHDKVHSALCIYRFPYLQIQSTVDKKYWGKIASVLNIQTFFLVIIL